MNGLCDQQQVYVGETPIFEKSVPGRVGVSLSSEEIDVNLDVPEDLLRKDPPMLPEISEPDVMRHFTRLSQMNASIDTHMYPLGSCTMKYNSRLAESVVRMPGFALAHPNEPEILHQGLLSILAELRDQLAAITGLPGISLQPSAGAHGELCGLMMIRALLSDRGTPRKKILVPDSAHGTNPASCALNAFEVVSLRTGEQGFLPASVVEQAMAPDVAGIMLTNPNTLGVFEQDMKTIANIVHQQGGLVYMDGANMNALLGVVQVAKMGVDVIHLNLHKTFGTPHGGGGPGSGPVACTKELEPFLPKPVLIGPVENPEWDHVRPKSIGKMRSFHGNVGVLLRAHAYISELGDEGLRHIGPLAILAANYLRARLSNTFDLAFFAPTMHEVVFTDKKQKERGITTLDIAKRLLDYGCHPPTIYFPLIAPGALMVEPTETESLPMLDYFVETMKAIDQEAQQQPDLLHAAPCKQKAGRFDEVQAARKPVLRYRANSDTKSTNENR